MAPAADAALLTAVCPAHGKVPFNYLQDCIGASPLLR
jgi:hypothetical protein